MTVASNSTLWSGRAQTWGRWISADDDLYPGARALALAFTAGTGFSPKVGRCRLHRAVEIGARVGLNADEVNDAVEQLLGDGWLIDRLTTADSDTAVIALPGAAWIEG